MSKYVFRLITLLTISSSCYTAQRVTHSLSLYFEINELQSQLNFNRLDSFFKTIPAPHLDVQLSGYADFLYTSQYNKQLSQKRAETVKSYILQRFTEKTINVTACAGYGETFSKETESESGDALQRRVDVLVTHPSQNQKEKKLAKQIPEEQPAVADKKPKTNNSGNRIEELKEGETLTLEGLNFIPGRHVLVKSAIPVLEELLQTLKDHPELEIEIQGHICCLSDDLEDGMDYDTGDMKLSENRALAIYNYLVRNGIDETRLRYKGYGHTRPKISPERTSQDEQANRRVEVKVLGN